MLAEFLDWHSSKFSGVNVRRVLGDDQPKGAGRKGRVAKRKRPIRPSRTGTKQCILQPIATSAATATDISSQSNDEVGRSRSTDSVSSSARELQCSTANSRYSAGEIPSCTSAEQSQAAIHPHMVTSLEEPNRPFFLKFINAYIWNTAITVC